MPTATRTDAGITIQRPTAEELDRLQVAGWPIWSKEPSTFPWRYDEQETCFFLEGEATIKTDGSDVVVRAGELVTFPRGLHCVWQITQAVRKHYRFD